MQTITSVNRKGRGTIPLHLRQQLGIRAGSKVEFVWGNDHIELRVKSKPSDVPKNAFDLLKSKRRAVPVDFDPASLLKP